MAALFSRIVYGPYRFGRRALTILLAGSLGVPVAITAVAIPVMLLAWAADVSLILFGALTPVVAFAVALGILFCIRKFDNWSVQAEAARWLAERSNTNLRERKWRTRAIRVASCIPALTVLLVFLFLPETWGILSHVGHPRAGNLPGYRVRIPATWVVWYVDGDRATGWSSVAGCVGRGIGFGVNPFTRWDWLSHWNIETAQFNQSEAPSYNHWMPEKEEIRNQRVVIIGTERLTCLEYIPFSWRHAAFDPWPPTVTCITCSGSGRLHASFTGMPSQIPTFYQVLDHIDPVK
jgi:hypothetical protein